MSGLIMFLFGIFGFIIGILLIFKPSSCIEMQRRFYLLINWRLEPVSMEKETRNTRLMGIFLVCVSAATFISAASAR